jgi:signal transduction histidine kinase
MMRSSTRKENWNILHPSANPMNRMAIGLHSGRYPMTRTMDSQNSTSQAAFWYQRPFSLFFFGCAGLALMTLVCFQLNVRGAVAGLLYMIVIVLVSLQRRLVPAVLVSLVAVVCLDYFFVDPIFRLRLAESLDVAALVAYVTTAVVITGLLSRVQRSVDDLRGSEARLRKSNEDLRLEISERKQAQEALRISEQRRLAQLARANEALRGSIDTLAQVPELDDFLGQVMAAITRQLGAVFSTLRMLDPEQNRLMLELVFRDNRVLSPDEAEFPENWRSRSRDEHNYAVYLTQPTTVTHLLDPDSPTPAGLREYLLGIGIKSGLIIPLISRGQAHGLFSLYFDEERRFDPEETEIARALATQASLAVQLTRLAKTARQSAILEERNRLAGEIHDSLAQVFAGISLQLFAAQEAITKAGETFNYVERAYDLAQVGLGEARRSALSLRSDVIEESGLTGALRMLADRSNIPGRLRCSFRTNNLVADDLPHQVQQHLLRIAQEAISNAIRHANPTFLNVLLQSNSTEIVLEIDDNGVGISTAHLGCNEGFGLGNMRERAKQLGAELDIRPAPGGGTSIIVRLPISVAHRQ